LISILILLYLDIAILYRKSKVSLIGKIPKKYGLAVKKNWGERKVT
jgi:hypothetical protein